MKRILLSICMALGLMAGWAQVEAKYGAGSVPVVNGRVLFQDTITTVLSKEEAFAKVEAWAGKRFTKPNVIISKFVSNDRQNQQLSFTAEEYLVFTNRFFVLDRTRINYWVEMQCIEQAVVIKMTRINYWYEEEREGGTKFTAEEWITDKWALNKKGTKLAKKSGKFRRKTIDRAEEIFTNLETFINRKAIKSIMK